MKSILLTVIMLVVVIAAFWAVRVHQVNESKERLVQKINLAMEGEDAICARKVDDYSWEEAMHDGTAPTYGPTLVLYSFKKASDDEFIFKRVFVRATTKVDYNAALGQLGRFELTVSKEMPQCNSRSSSLAFLRTLGPHSEATLVNRYWMLTSLRTDNPGAIAYWEGHTSGISSGGKYIAMVSSEKIIYRIAKRQKDYTEYFTDMFAGKSSLLDD